MYEDNHIFLKNGREKLFAKGLDQVNQLGATREISFMAHAISRAGWPCEEPFCVKIEH